MTTFPTFVDVPDPADPPVGAVHADAAFLNSLTGAVNALEADPLTAVSPQDTLPNEHPFWYVTNPLAIDGRVYSGTVGDNNDVYVQEWTQPAEDGPFWLRRYLLGYVGGTTKMDDHNPAGLAAKVGKPLVAFFSGHNFDNVMFYRSTTQNIEDIKPGGMGFGPVQTLELPVTGANSYPVVNVHGDNIWVLHRTGPIANQWSITKFGAWATETPVTYNLIRSDYQTYTMGRIVGDVFRIIAADHPDLGNDTSVRYFEVNVVTGVVSAADGTVLGDLDGTNLPLLNTTVPSVFTSAGVEKPWTFDVGYGASPEIVFTSGDRGPNFDTNGTYYYGTFTGGAWTVNDVAPVGRFLGGAYFPSIVFVPGQTGQVAYARESAGTFYLERKTTTDNGATWATTLLNQATSPTVTRAFAVRAIDGTAPIFDTLVTEIDVYTTFTNWVSRFRPVPTSAQTRRLPDIIAADVTERPRPEAGLYLPGTAGRYVWGPGSLTLPAEGFRLEVDVALDNWANGDQQTLLGKETSTTARGPRLFINGDGKLGFSYSIAGTTAINIIPGAAPGFADGQRVEIYASFIPSFNDGTQYRMRFEYRVDGRGPWVHYYTTQVDGATSFYDTATAPWEVGSRWRGTFSLAKGRFYRASVMSAGGTAVLGEWRADNLGGRDDHSALWTVEGGGTQPPLAAGRYLLTSSPGITGTATGTGTGILRMSPWLVTRRTRLDRLGATVSTIGDVGSKVRLGIYADDGTCRPGARVIDAGQINGDSATVQELTVDVTLEPGLYWVGAVIQAVTTTQPALQCNAPQWTPPVPILMDVIPSTTQSALGMQQTGITGALPSTLASPSNSANAPARLFVRTA